MCQDAQNAQTSNVQHSVVAQDPVYVCMYVCVCRNVGRNECRYSWMFVCMYVYVCICRTCSTVSSDVVVVQDPIYVCMYVCMYVYLGM
jgi:hypothetical protein